MAGDWIKMRAELHTHPKVVRIMSALHADKLRVIGGLHAVWCLFDAHSEDGQLEGYTPEALDCMIGWDGFTEALAAVAWVEIGDGFLSLPRFDEHNGRSAKRRATETQRKREERSKSVLNLSAIDADKLRSREEKRREEQVSEEAKASSSSPVATRSRPQVPCQYQAIVDAYHEALPMLPRVKLMDDKRKAAMRKLWAWVLSSAKADGSRRATTGDEAVAWLRDYFGRAACNTWLTGQEPSRTHPGWKADFDFLLTDRGMKAVIERTEVVA
jgi:hypothetical protein